MSKLLISYFCNVLYIECSIEYKNGSLFKIHEVIINRPCSLSWNSTSIVGNCSKFLCNGKYFSSALFSKVHEVREGKVTIHFWWAVYTFNQSGVQSCILLAALSNFWHLLCCAVRTAHMAMSLFWICNECFLVFCKQCSLQLWWLIGLTCSIVGHFHLHKCSTHEL